MVDEAVDAAPGTRRRVRLAVVVTLLALLAAVAWIGVRGWQARQHLTDARAGVTTLQEQALAGEVDAARDTLVLVQDDAGRARSLTSDPVWRAAGVLPYLGDDLVAVTAVAREVDRVASEVLEPVVDPAAVLDPAALQPRDGAVDLAPLAEAFPLLESAAASLQTSRTGLDRIDADGLTTPVADARGELAAELERAADSLRPAAQATRLLPGMLGDEGPRTYLVLFQNNAEVRATGGIPGPYAVLTADAGRIAFTEQGTASGLGNFLEPVLELLPGVLTLFGKKPAIYLADVTMTADWTLSAALAREMYLQRTGIEVDRVGSVDPVALSYLLEATGPVEMAEGRTLGSADVVPFLLSEAYRLIDDDDVDSAAQDEASAAVADAAFAVLVSGRGEPRETLLALDRGVDEGRLLLWSGHQDEQRVLAGTAMAGPLRPAGTGGDATGAEPQDYLRQDVALSAPTCLLGDGARRTLDLTLTSTAPADAATTLPEYVTGTTLVVPRGSNRTQVVVYGPAGGSFGQVRLDGEPVAFGTAQEAGRPTAVTTAVLGPGQTVAVSVDLFLPSDAGGRPVVRTTPTVVAAQVQVAAPTSQDRLPTCSPG